MEKRRNTAGGQTHAAVAPAVFAFVLEELARADNFLKAVPRFGMTVKAPSSLICCRTFSLS